MAKQTPPPAARCVPPGGFHFGGGAGPVGCPLPVPALGPSPDSLGLGYAGRIPFVLQGPGLRVGEKGYVGGALGVQEALRWGAVPSGLAPSWPAQPTISPPLLGSGSQRVRSLAWATALGSALLVIMPTAPTLVPPILRGAMRGGGGLPHIQPGVPVREERVTSSETLCPCVGPGLLG